MLIRFLSDKPLPPPVSLVHGYLQKGSLIVLSGQAGKGKTALATNLVMAGIDGGTWLDMPVKGGPTLWIAYEAAHSTERRIRALAAGSASTPPVAVASQLPLLTADEAPKAIDAALKAASECFGAPVELVVVDALTSAMRGSDENASASMTKALGVLLKLIEAHGVSVLLLTHTGKSGGLETRGHSAVIGDATSAFAIDCKRGVTSLVCTKQRDMELSPPIPFRIAANGSELRVERDHSEPVESSQPEGQPLPKGAARMLEEIKRLGGRTTLNALREACKQAFKSKTEGAFRSAFSGARKELEGRALIVIQGDVVALAEASVSLEPSEPSEPSEPLEVLETSENLTRSDISERQKKALEKNPYKGFSNVSDTQPSPGTSELADADASPMDMAVPAKARLH